ncbi:MAG TPA: hypothetical protein VJ183_17740 [Chloroflexia bacterium]|nr:hypothetical protein [Chloroflexia bacterium]
MAKDDKIKELRQKSRFAAMEGLKPNRGFPTPPRKAMKQAKKLSRKLPYQVPPYPEANPVQVYRWAQYEWWKLGRWQALALPVVIIAGLLTWEKEKALQEVSYGEVERIEAKRVAAETYRTFGRSPTPKRKLLGFIPLPGQK